MAETLTQSQAPKSSDASFLRIENLTKEFDGIPAVKNVSLNIRRAELFALLGSSGCGKSTLLRMLAGFETPTSGRIILDGQDITDMPPYRRPINMMFQSYALFPHLTVWDNVAFGLKRANLPRAQIEERVAQLLELVQLKQYGKRRPHQLSGGQQQRVALARSLALRPQLLLLDEPLGALDRKLRERTQFELVNILESVGVTCVMVTHDQEEAMTMSKRIAVMSQGEFLQIGTPSEIYETPNCRFVADFIGDVNLFDGKLIVDEPDHVVVETPECRHWVGHGVTGSLGMPLSVAIRPEKILIDHDKPEDEFNCVQGEITEVAYLGSRTIFHLRLATGKLLEASMANSARHRERTPTWGDRVWASWSRDAIVVLVD
jgi:putrescine transport system ATP-binding protein